MRAFGLDFENPIGVAAGLDKNAELVPLWTQIGCGFSEVGSVTARPSDGNPRPRAFRLPLDEALVNRMGLNNQGAARVAERIAALGPKRTRPLAINVAKTHDPAILGDAALDDFAESTQALLPLADVLVLNVSCPNTAEGKTFEDPGALDALLERVMAVREGLGLGTPVLVKLSPPPAADFDPGPVDELIDLSRSRGVAGFVATNTASDRAGLERTPDREVDAIGRGGLSGAPLRARAL
ncbi:MAG: dihydroorotate dehydrogenase 2, partial [Planctomycetota bacterium]